MRAIFIPALVALGIGLAGTSPTLAAPANGEVIGQAAYLNPGVEQVYWRRYHHWIGWRHRYHRRWCLGPLTLGRPPSGCGPVRFIRPPAPGDPRAGARQ